ncbi:unnamed protein product [Gadus morhua 'NCC']
MLLGQTDLAKLLWRVGMATACQARRERVPVIGHLEGRAVNRSPRLVTLGPNERPLVTLGPNERPLGTLGPNERPLGDQS